MASLNTLRTKYGIVLSVVIALVLVAFILGDQLSMRNRQTEVKDNTVLTINGKNIKASDYAKYQEKYNMGGDNSEEYANELANYIYSRIMFDKQLHPAFEAAGLGFNEADRELMKKQLINNVLSNPQAQMLTPEQIANYINNMWAQSQMTLDVNSETTKATNVYGAGLYTNRLEVEEQLRNENLAFDGEYVMIPYTAIETEEATEAEINAYYNANKKENPRYGARTVKYVTFSIEASQEDMAAIEANIKEADAKVKAANGDAKLIKEAVRGVNGKINNKYVAISALSDEEAKAIKANNHYGPVLNNNTWTAKYILSKVNAPESFKFDAIAVESNVAGEKLIADIKAVNGNLAEIEAGANATAKTKMLRDMNELEAAKFINAKVGDLFVHTIDNKPSVIKITELGKKTDFVLTANVETKIEASKQTKDAIVKAAEDFMAAAGKNGESFNNAALELKKSALTQIVYRNTPENVNPTIPGITNSRNLAIWAYDAKVGQKKNHFAENVIYVCMVTDIDNNKYQPKNEIMIKRQLANDKKFDKVKNTIAMDTTMDGAVKGKFADVEFTSSSVDNRFEPALVGAIARSKELGVATVVKGNAGAYVFVVKNIKNGDAVKNADIETKRAEMNNMTKMMEAQMFIDEMINNATVVDKRGAGQL